MHAFEFREAKDKFFRRVAGSARLDDAGKELARYERSFHTDVDQASLPSKPLVVGPGYEPNPDLQPN